MAKPSKPSDAGVWEREIRVLVRKLVRNRHTLLFWINVGSLTAKLIHWIFRVFHAS